MNSTEPEFWNQRYRAEQMPWDQHGVPVALMHYLRHTRESGAVLIPGCGSGYEVRAFAEFGWRPLAIDFSAAAIDRARRGLGAHASAVRFADFFADDLGGPFDFVYERTFLCSLPPDRWPDYARRMAHVLKPDGKLIGIFVYGEEPEPPPFPLPNDTAAKLLLGSFALTADKAIPAEQSLPLFAGKERWQEWQRK